MMRCREFLHSEPEAASLFAAGGPLDATKRWATNTEGARRMTARDGSLYHFKSGPATWRQTLRALALGRRPLSGPGREWLLLHKLRTRGFRTMHPVAWGEQRIAGLPVRGFLLVKDAGGREVAELLVRAPGEERRALWREIGSLLAELHRDGFFQPVRLKDLLRTADGLVLIDRETSKPWRTFFTQRWCVKALRRSLYRSRLADGKRPDIPQDFWQAYVQAMTPQWKISPEDLARRVHRQVQIRA